MAEFWVNMGPQHPMTYGLWNMKVKIDGERITDAAPEIGYPHRGDEQIMEVREFPRIGGVRNDLPPDFDKYCAKVIKHFREKLKEYERLFHDSKIFLMRTQGVGRISRNDAVNWGVTGPNLRACGVDVDFRRREPYETDEEGDFEPQGGKGGDGGGS